MRPLLTLQVRRRARGACEYCRIPESAYPTVPFQLDHTIARQHRGRSLFSNLALSCLHCNSHKGPNIAAYDPKSGKLVRLFNPRRHRWRAHFRWNGPTLVGRTPIGRATVELLDMNDADLVEVRRWLIAEGVFPPID